MTVWHLPFFFSHISLYVISTPRGPVLVDTGLPGMGPLLRRRLRERGIDVDGLAGVVVTHCHRDHVGGVGDFVDRGIPLMAHHREVPFLTGAEAPPAYGPGPGRAIAWAEHTLLPRRRRYPDVIALDDDEWLFDSDWRVMPAPGHSPGSLALWNENSGALLSGDTLVSTWGNPKGAHPVYTADLPQALESARRLLDLEPRQILPGHGPVLNAERYARLRVDLRAAADVCSAPRPQDSRLHTPPTSSVSYPEPRLEPSRESWHWRLVWREAGRACARAVNRGSAPNGDPRPGSPSPLRRTHR